MRVWEITLERGKGRRPVASADRPRFTIRRASGRRQRLVSSGKRLKNEGIRVLSEVTGWRKRNLPN